MNLPKSVQLIGAILLCQLAGIIGSVFTTKAIPTWYATLIKPVINPPNWLFGPVWLVLYTLIGITLFYLWQERKAQKSKTKQEKVQTLIWLFYVNLLFNTLWSIVFFGLRNPLFGIVIITVVWGTAGILVLNLDRINKRLAWVYLPYFLWVSFAMILNILLWSLNRFTV